MSREFDSIESISEKKCLNCGHTVADRYCPNCGQNTATERFDWRYLGRKLIATFDIDKGFFHTLWLLMVKPGTSIREYIDGHRVGFTNAIRLFVILGAIATFLTFQYHLFYTPEQLADVLRLRLEDWDGYGRYSVKYFSFFTLTAMPYFSLFTWIFFKSTGFNYVENLVFNFYVGSGQFAIVILMTPLLLAFPGSNMVMVYAAINFAYNVWAVMFFFRVKNPLGLIKGFLAVILPQVSTVYFNYLLYRISPQSIWEFLDATIG